jgi:pectate lyase
MISPEAFMRRVLFPKNKIISLFKRLAAAACLFVLLGTRAHGAAPGCIGFASVDGDSSIGMSIAGGTTGGNGGTTVTVSTQAQLESALDLSGPQVIQVQGVINLTPLGTREDINSNTTLLGVGCGSGILGGRLVVDNQSNVIIQNLILGGTYIPGDPEGKCCNYDGITIWHSSHHVWVDHCDLSHAEDGLCDITDMANYVTVSWCHLHDHNKASLVGRSDSATSDIGYLKVTYHHDWFDHVWMDTPRFRFGMTHLFNNYYTNVAQYCAWDTMAGQMVVEDNNFGVSAINPFMIGTPTPTYQPTLTASNNVFDPTATGYQDTFGTAFNPATFYAYSPDSPAAVPGMALTGTGPCGNLATATPTPAAAVSNAWRISAGGPAYVDSAGNTWAADTQYLGGYSFPATAVVSISGTSDAALYQDERYGDLFNSNNFSYSFPVPSGTYQLTLKFAETDFTGTGQRVFNVAVNGTPVLSNFDLYADAGGGDKADDKVFNNISPSAGQITVSFLPGSADSPKVNALQVITQPPIPTATPTAVPTATPVLTPTPTPPAPNGKPYVYSNPSSGPTVHFVYTMASSGTAAIKVWNASGILAASLQAQKSAGQQQSDLDVRSFAPGHYFYQVDLRYDSGGEDRFASEVLAIQK